MATNREEIYKKLKSNFEAFFDRLQKACEKAGRNPQEITVVGAAKTVPYYVIDVAQELGLKIIGENRVQEAYEKYQHLGNKVSWHLIGHLQTNKVKKALEIFDMIQSVDSLHLALEIEKRASMMGKIVPVLIEVNTSGEPSKFGIEPGLVFALITEILNLPHLKLMGFMTLGPGLAVENPEHSRPCFRELYELREKVQKEFNLALPYLSMGMSSDFEVAISEGSNMIRIGTLLFGPRPAYKEA
ncbi:MAG: YggS family pyridoxal phosphate-dependent enzyme [candidate division WOR-3 bacterium]